MALRSIYHRITAAEKILNNSGNRSVSGIFRISIIISGIAVLVRQIILNTIISIIMEISSGCAIRYRSTISQKQYILLRSSAGIYTCRLNIRMSIRTIIFSIIIIVVRILKVVVAVVKEGKFDTFCYIIDSICTYRRYRITFCQRSHFIIKCKLRNIGIKKSLVFIDLIFLRHIDNYTRLILFCCLFSGIFPRIARYSMNVLFIPANETLFVAFRSMSVFLVFLESAHKHILIAVVRVDVLFKAAQRFIHHGDTRISQPPEDA